MRKKWLLAGAFAVLVYLLRAPLTKLLTLLLLSVTLAYLFCPISVFFEKHCGFSPRLAALVTLLLNALVLAGVLLFGVPAFGRQLRAFSQELPARLATWQHFTEKAAERLRNAGFSAALADALREQSERLLSGLLEKGVSAFSGIFDGIRTKSYLLLSPVLSFFLIKDRKKLFSGLLKAVPLKIRRETMKVCLAVQGALDAYVRGQMLVSLATGAMTALGLAVIGVPFALLLGLMMAVFDLIPYFGPWLGAVPVVLLALPGGSGQVLLSGLVVFAAQQAEALILAPSILGAAAALHPGIVLLTLLAGSFLWGLPGMLYAIPLLLICRAIFSAVRESCLQKREIPVRVPK